MRGFAAAVFPGLKPRGFSPGWGAAGVAVVSLALLTACTPPVDDVATYTIERRDFRHQVTADGELKAVTETAITVPHETRERMRLAWLATEGYVEKDEIVARFDPKTLEDRLREGNRDRESTTFEMKKAEVASEKKQAQHDTEFQVADLELDHARRFQMTDDQVFSRQQIAGSEIDEELATEKKAHAAFSRDNQGALAKTEMELLEIQQKKATLKIDQAEKALRSLEVRAPHSGILSLSRRWNGEPVSVGEEMWPGQEIAEIPDLSTMEAQVYILEADAGGLEVGKRAEVVLDAEPGHVYSGKIYQVDPVAQPRLRGSPVQYFGVKVELEDAETIAKRPGQRLHATLYLAEAKDALVVPRQAVFSEDGEDRVYVRNGKGFVPRAVQVGARSMGTVVVEEGLREGDVVALREPLTNGNGGAPAEDALQDDKEAVDG